MFTKYSATGNDFILVDGRTAGVKDSLTRDKVSSLCHRKWGIGSDGLIILLDSSKGDFAMRYLNADGGEVEMCGNGLRAITHFAHSLNIVGKSKDSYVIETFNGVYETYNLGSSVKIKMTELYDDNELHVKDLFPCDSAYYVNTGVPHTVLFVGELEDRAVAGAGEMAHDGRFISGCNINFAKVEKPGVLFVRTYERGVEAETLSCGTGAVAVAHAYRKNYLACDEVIVKTLGGDLKISPIEEGYSLEGDVVKVFSGRVS